MSNFRVLSRIFIIINFIPAVKASANIILMTKIAVQKQIQFPGLFICDHIEYSSHIEER